MKCGKFFCVVIGVLLSSFLCGCEAVHQSAGPALPPRGDTAFARACDYEAQSEIFLAQAEYARAIALDPKDTRAYVNLGQTYEKMGLHDSAAAVWHAAIHVNPNDSRAFNLLGNHYTARRQYKKALACYERAVECDPENTDAHWNVAMASRHLGIEQQAGVHYAKFLELASGRETDGAFAAKLYIATMKDDVPGTSDSTSVETTMFAETAPAEETDTDGESEDVFAETCETDLEACLDEQTVDVAEETPSPSQETSEQAQAEE